VIAVSGEGCSLNSVNMMSFISTDVLRSSLISRIGCPRSLISIIETSKSTVSSGKVSGVILSIVKIYDLVFWRVALIPDARTLMLPRRVEISASNKGSGWF
jgi:hypothetical protein